MHAAIYARVSRDDRDDADKAAVEDAESVRLQVAGAKAFINFSAMISRVAMLLGIAGAGPSGQSGEKTRKRPCQDLKMTSRRAHTDRS